MEKTEYETESGMSPEGQEGRVEWVRAGWPGKAQGRSCKPDHTGLCGPWPRVGILNLSRTISAYLIISILTLSEELASSFLLGDRSGFLTWYLILLIIS